jgi:Tetracyclin repressor-like, C-terminal domain
VEKIAASRGTAAQRMRNLVASVEKAHSKLYMSDRKLHELIEAAVTENWTIMREHNQRMIGMLEQIIASGMAAGEFHPGDAALAARLVNTACIRFCHPRLMVENEQEPEPVLDQMVDFCLAALVPHPPSAIRPDACATE